MHRWRGWPCCCHQHSTYCDGRWSLEDIYVPSLHRVIQYMACLEYIAVCSTQLCVWDCYSWHWTDTKSIECMSVCVCLSVCLHKPFVHDSDHNFCPIFLKFGTRVTHATTKTNFDGQVPRVNGPLFWPSKPLFGENLQLKPMESILVYRRPIKLSSQNLTRISNKLNFTKIVKFGDKRGVDYHHHHHHHHF